MDTKDFVHNISLLLGSQQIHYITHGNKKINVHKTTRAVQAISGGFNIYSFRMVYNYTKSSHRINLRKQTKLTTSFRTLLLPVLLTDKDSLLKQIVDLDGPTIHSVEFTTNLCISTTPITIDDGIVPVTILGQTFYINYNEESDFHNFKITPKQICKNRVVSILGKHNARDPFLKYYYNKPNQIYKYKHIEYEDSHEYIR